MHTRRSLLLVPALSLASLTGLGCRPRRQGPKANIDPQEKATSAQIQPAEDPIEKVIAEFQKEIRQHFMAGRYQAIDELARELRKAKATFANGSWKIVQLYDALECSDEAAETEWEKHEGRHEEWLALQPQSITARVAYADFLVSYAWHARGSGYANTVTELGWKLLKERLQASGRTLNDARTLPELDPCWWSVALRVGLGLGYTKEQFDTLMEEAHEYEPKFWGYDTTRAYSLLPRWHGEPGEWEAFAKETAHREGSLGAELYGRIIMGQRVFFSNIFRESKASWPMTRTALAEMRQKYPESLTILSESALLATMGNDRKVAQAMFEELGDRYMPSVFGTAELFVHYRQWARTGKW